MAINVVLPIAIFDTLKYIKEQTLNINTINMFSGVFTAIGTVGAVITSLVLSYGSKKVKANATISFKTVYTHNHEGQYTYEPAEEFVCLTVTNIGVKPFKVNAIGVRDTQSNKAFQIMPDYNHQCCTQFNHLFLESVSGDYVVPLKTFTASLLKASQTENVRPLKMRRLKKIKFIVSTNVGQCVKVKADKSFYHYFIDVASCV